MFNLKSKKSCLWNEESWALESGIKLKESGIPRRIVLFQREKITNPALESGILGVVSRILGRDPFNQNSDRSDREKRTTSKGGPVFSKLFRLDRTDPLSFGPKFPEILVEWIAPLDSFQGPASLQSKRFFLAKTRPRPAIMKLSN